MVRIAVQQGFWDAPPPILLSKSSSSVSTDLPKDPRKRKSPTQLSPALSKENINNNYTNNNSSNSNMDVAFGPPYYVLSFSQDDYHKRVQESLALLKQSLYAAPAVLVAHSPFPEPSSNNNFIINDHSNQKKKKNKQQQQQQHVYVPKVVCKYWMEGKCSKGSLCTFSHALSPTVSPDQARSGQPCTFHRLGQCMKGAKCLFSHDLSRWPCKYFHLNGRCKDGDGCRFGHALPLDDEGRRLLDEMEREDENKMKINNNNSNNNNSKKRSQNFKKGNTKMKKPSHYEPSRNSSTKKLEPL